MIRAWAEHIQAHQLGVKVVGDDLEGGGDVQEVGSEDGAIFSTDGQFGEESGWAELMDGLGYGDLLHKVHIPSRIKTQDHTALAERNNVCCQRSSNASVHILGPLIKDTPKGNKPPYRKQSKHYTAYTPCIK